MAQNLDPNAASVGEGVYGLPHTVDEAAVVLVPVPWEATVSYGTGTAQGPAAILEASHQVDLFDRETGRPYATGIAMLEPDDEIGAWNAEARVAARPVIDAGGPGDDPVLTRGRDAVDALSERLNERVYEIASEQLSAGKLVGVVGGDHSAPFGAIRASAEHEPGLGVLHIDAHADLRQAYEGFRWSHASIMWNVLEEIPQVSRLVQVGVRDFCDEEFDRIRGARDRVRTHFDPDMRDRLLEGESFAHIAGGVVSDLPRDVYVSFDIDGLDPALCPNTGTPVPAGLSFAEATRLLKTVVRSGRRIVGFDLCEVAPGKDTTWDADVGARILYKLIGFALASRA